MARTMRDGSLSNRTNRLKLPIRQEPYWAALAPGKHLGYYRTRTGGSWVAKWRDKDSGARRKTTFGIADDFQEANGAEVLSWEQASDKALEWFKEKNHEAALQVQGEDLPQGAATVRDALNLYIRYARREGQKGVDIAVQVINARILPELGNVELAKLNPGRIERWKESLATSPRLRTGKKRETQEFMKAPKTKDQKRARQCTANRILAILKKALNLALEKGWVRDGRAWQLVKPFKGVTAARVRFLSAEESARLVNVCPPDFRQLVQAALLTGCRYGELTRVLVKDFNPKAGTLFIAESKSGKPRHIVLTDEGKELFTVLTAGKPSQAVLFQRSGVVKRTKRAEIGQNWGHTDQTPYMRQACEDAELEALSFHELRHTYASMLVNRGVPLAYVAAQLGHADTRMVEKHYGHLAPTALAEAIRKDAPRLGIVEEPKVAPLKVKQA